MPEVILFKYAIGDRCLIEEPQIQCIIECLYLTRAGICYLVQYWEEKQSIELIVYEKDLRLTHKKELYD